MAMLTLQGAWSQLKICADQTACPRHARLSPEPRLLQRDDQAQGLIAPTEQACKREPAELQPALFSLRSGSRHGCSH